MGLSAWGSRRRVLALAAPAALVVVVVVGLVIAATGHGTAGATSSAPVPALQNPPSVSVDTVPPGASVVPHGPLMTASAPSYLAIPAIGVRHDLGTVGRNADGTIEVPPLSDVALPAWYRYSPTPGQLGPSVIVGHVDSAAMGRGVFYNLGALKPGDTIQVGRADQSVATFTVRSVAEYPKSAFPTKAGYGDTSDAELRLITCGGKFDGHNYVDNIVAFAQLTN